MIAFLIFIRCIFTEPNEELFHFTILHTTDTHGYINGHRHNETLTGTLADYENMITTLKNNVKEREYVLAFDSGDIFQGTGLSDATPVCGEFIFDIFRKTSIDAFTMGNHELYERTASENILKNYKEFYGERYLAGNVFHTGDELPLGNYYRKMTLDNFGDIVIIGFLFSFTANADNTKVVPPVEAIKDAKMDEALDNPNLKMIFLVCHMDINDEEAEIIYNHVKGKKPGLPVIFLGGHTHQEKQQIKQDVLDLRVESLCFLQKIGVADFYLDKEGNFVDMGRNSNSRNEGMISSFVRTFDSTTNTAMSKANVSFVLANVTEMQKFVNFDPAQGKEWDTPNSKLIRTLIQDKSKELGLDTLYGCASRDYSDDNKVAGNLHKHLVQLVYPKLKPFQKAGSKSIPTYLVNSGANRAPLYKGTIVYEDVFMIDPYQNYFCAIRNVPGSVMTEIQDKQVSKMNSEYSYPRSPNSDHLRLKVSNNTEYKFSDRYTQTVTTFSAKKTYDMISTDYDITRILKLVESLHPGKFTKECDTTKTTRPVFLEYIKTYMKCPNPKEKKIYTLILAIVLGLAVVAICIITAISCVVMRKRNKRELEGLRDTTEHTGLLSDSD